MKRALLGYGSASLAGKEAAAYEKLAWRFVAVLRNAGIPVVEQAMVRDLFVYIPLNAWVVTRVG